MVNSTLLEKLDRATDNAVKVALSKAIPLPITKKVSVVGDFIVEKKSNGYYDVKSLDNTILYSDISSYDVAVIICQRLSVREVGIVKKVLTLDDQYQKYRTEMLHLLSCLKGATRRRDYERMAILEDKFQIAEMMARRIKDSINFFKKTK